MRTPEEIKTRMSFYMELKDYLKRYKENKNEAIHTERKHLRHRERVKAHN